jgi:hypothetical protein
LRASRVDQRRQPLWGARGGHTRLFNHFLSYLPEFDLYADSTVVVAPFGTLPADEYGKPLARAGETGASFTTLPLVTAQDNEEKPQTAATLAAVFL